MGTVERYAVVESNAGFDGDNIRYQGLADRNARDAPVYQGMSASFYYGIMMNMHTYTMRIQYSITICLK